MNDKMNVEDLELLKNLIETLDEKGEVFKLSKIVIDEHEKARKKEKVKKIMEGEKEK